MKDLLDAFHFLLVLSISLFGAIKPTVFIVNKLFPEEPPGKFVIGIILMVIYVVFFYILGALTKLFRPRRK
jgi:hypothetical protein